MERLALDRFSSPWLRNQHVERYRWASGFAPGLRALDAACGTGYGARLLLEAGASEVTSLDVAADAAVEARRGGELDSLRFVRGDVTRLPLRSGAVQLYCCFETLEHVEDDGALLAEARRVLEPGGKLLCSTPNRNLLSPGHTIHDRPRNPFHVREYSIPELDELLRRYFRDVELFGQTWFSEGHGRLLAGAGARSSLLAVRLHQLSNVLMLPWERALRHRPVPLGRPGVPEVVIGVAKV
jgi:ubiquinone/menaquinone biosynthesis C-methylase UbiE